MYKLFLCLRYLRKRRIAFFAIAAVWLCTAMVLIVVSVMGGFLDMVKARSRGLLGDLVMENGALQGFPYYQEFIDEIKKEMPQQIEEATPVIVNYGLLRFPSSNITKPVQVVGIRLDETCRVNDFKKGLFLERYYPGTDTLKPEKVPAFGLGGSGQLVLPPEFQNAYDQWLKAATPKEKAEADRQQVGRYPGPGLFCPSNYFDPNETGPGWMDDKEPGLIVGIDVCAKRTPKGDYERYYHRGYKLLLTLFPLTPKGTLAGGGMSAPTMAFRLVDDSSTGVYDIDSVSVYGDFDIIQNALLMGERKLDNGTVIPPRATQVQIKIRAGQDPYAARKLVQDRWERFVKTKIEPIQTRLIDLQAQLEDIEGKPGQDEAAVKLNQARQEEIVKIDLLRDVEIKTWEEKQAKFIMAVEKEKVLVTILFCIISLVAVLLVGCIFYMIVQQKTRDIGIVKSVGATWHGVASIFLGYGAAVGIVGGILGLVCGAVFVHYINDIQELLMKLNPNLQVWSPEVYTFSRIPNSVKPWDVVVIFLVAILASVTGSLIAAVKAARVWPVEALRYE
jgi:lipoprotein-releasing system permease protein